MLFNKMMKKIKHKKSLREHYKELNATARHYDYQFWLVPGAAYALSILLYSFAFSQKPYPDFLKNGILWIIPVITFGFLFQMINERAYQLINKERIKESRKKLGLENTLRDEDRYGRWFYWWVKRIKAPCVLISIMVIVLILEVGLAIYLTFMH